MKIVDFFLKYVGKIVGALPHKYGATLVVNLAVKCIVYLYYNKNFFFLN
jgi:hypothetical protein